MENPTFIPRTKPPTKSLRAFKNIVSEKEHGFTLLELVVVILIIGVLATLGFTQYGMMVEKSRGAEAKAILGDVRKLAFVYRLANGTITGMTYSDVNIGSASDQIPYPCRSSHYFAYDFWAHPSSATDPVLRACASRCGVNGWGPGKPPQGTISPLQGLCLQTDFSNGTDTWQTYGVSY
jgi:prepilin-type N-terminal cleavage/methylation domain-containing protein